MFNPYPSINDPDFYSKIISKKEIKKNSAKITKQTQEDACNKSMFKLFEHQKLVRNFLSPHTPYQNLMLFHDVGMGKTCSAISIAESHKDIIAGYNQKIIVILEDGVRQNFLNELYNDSKDDNQCTGTSYLNMTILERKRYIKSVYKFITLDKFTNEICKLSKTSKGRQTIRDTFSNTLIIVDEVHNVREYDAISSKGVEDPGCKRYDALRNVVTIANDSKLLLMSATPMFDDPKEIVSLMNLFILNERDNLKLSDIPKYKIDAKKLFTKEDGLTSDGKKILSKNLKGIVSYIRGDNPTTYPSMNFGKGTNNLGIFKKLKVVSAPMSEYQRNGYDNSLDDNLVLLKQNSIVFMGGMDKVQEQEALKEKNLKDKKGSVSIKLYKLLKNLESSGLSFIYSEFVSNSLRHIKTMLSVNGYDEYTGRKTDKPAFILLDGSVDAKQRAKLIKIFNSPENKDGKIIKIVMGSAVLKEGITLKNVRNVHIMEPWYNMSRLKQVWGRAIRSCSHVALPASKRKVEIFLYASTFDDTPINKNLLEKSFKEVKKDIPFDIHFYKHSENKEIKIEKIVNLLRSVAIDCELHKEHNRNNADKIECLPTMMGNDDTTYAHHDTFFNQPEVDHIIRIIKKTIKEHLVYEMKDNGDIINQAIYQLLPTDKDLSIFPHLMKIGNQRGYIIKRGKYLIFQPLDGKSLNKSNRERMSMYERNHPGTKIFKQRAYRTNRQINNTGSDINGPVEQITTTPPTRKAKLTVVKNDAIRGIYRGLLMSDGNIKLQKIDKNITDKRVKSTGRLCTTFTGTNMEQVLKDMKIPKDIIAPYIMKRPNGSISIKGKDGLCQAIVKYFYPVSNVPSLPSSSTSSRRGSQNILKTVQNGKFVFMLVKNGNSELVKIKNTETTSRGGNACPTLKVDVINEIIKMYPGLKFVSRKQFCNDLKKRVFN